ncbi:MAG TPA: hypothetical protein VFE62_17605 [Gemmataceae bacterium]|nr:hypothetical protein [Gemmataceae bacterium]
MLRASCCLVLVAIVGCRMAEREGMNPLPENGAPLSFDEMLSRARGQAASALDAYYIDAWLELEQAGQRLEQSARLLPKSTHIPENLKTKVEPESNLLRQDARKLVEAARNRNSTEANAIMQRINERIRLLRPTANSEDKK